MFFHQRRSAKFLDTTTTQRTFQSTGEASPSNSDRGQSTSRYSLATEKMLARGTNVSAKRKVSNISFDEPNTDHVRNRVFSLVNSRGPADITLVATIDNTWRKAHRSVLKAANLGDAICGRSKYQIELPVSGRVLDLILETLYTDRTIVPRTLDSIAFYAAARAASPDEAARMFEVELMINLKNCVKSPAFYELTRAELDAIESLLAAEELRHKDRLLILRQILEWGKRQDCSTDDVDDLSLRVFGICQNIFHPPETVMKLFVVKPTKAGCLDLIEIDPWLEKRSYPKLDFGPGEECIIAGVLNDETLITHRWVDGSADKRWRLPSHIDPAHGREEVPYETNAKHCQEVAFYTITDTEVKKLCSFRSSPFLGMVVFQRRIFVWTRKSIYVMEGERWRHLVRLDQTAISGLLIIRSYGRGQLHFAFQDCSRRSVEYLTCAILGKEIDYEVFPGQLLGSLPNGDLLIKAENGHVLSVNDEGQTTNDYGKSMPGLHTLVSHRGSLYCTRWCVEGYRVHAFPLGESTLKKYGKTTSWGTKVPYFVWSVCKGERMGVRALECATGKSASCASSKGL